MKAAAPIRPAELVIAVLIFAGLVAAAFGWI